MDSAVITWMVRVARRGAKVFFMAVRDKFHRYQIDTMKIQIP